MCATCVAQGVVYLGGAVGSLRVMAARAEAKRIRNDAPVAQEPSVDDAPSLVATGS